MKFALSEQSKKQVSTSFAKQGKDNETIGAYCPNIYRGLVRLAEFVPLKLAEMNFETFCPWRKSLFHIGGKQV